MKLYFARPLFTTPERTWNAEVTAELRAAGHEVFRALAGSAGAYNPMITEAATIRIDLPAGSTVQVSAMILSALARIETGIEPRDPPGDEASETSTK